MRRSHDHRNRVTLVMLLLAASCSVAACTGRESSSSLTTEAPAENSSSDADAGSLFQGELVSSWDAQDGGGGEVRLTSLGNSDVYLALADCQVGTYSYEWDPTTGSVSFVAKVINAIGCDGPASSGVVALRSFLRRADLTALKHDDAMIEVLSPEDPSASLRFELADSPD